MFAHCVLTLINSAGCRRLSFLQGRSVLFWYLQVWLDWCEPRRPCRRIRHMREMRHSILHRQKFVGFRVGRRGIFQDWTWCKHVRSGHLSLLSHRLVFFTFDFVFTFPGNGFSFHFTPCVFFYFLFPRTFSLTITHVTCPYAEFC